MRANFLDEVSFHHKYDPMQVFRHLIHIVNGYQVPSASSGPLFLLCDARREYFWASEIYECSTSPCLAVDLVDSSGTWCGILRLNHRFHDDEIAMFHNQCQLIELSAVRRHLSMSGTDRIA